MNVKPEKCDFPKASAAPDFRLTDLNEAAGAADAARELNHEGSRRPVDW